MRRVLNKCMQFGFVSDFVRMDAVGLIDSLGSHLFRANIIIPYCFPHSFMQNWRDKECRDGVTVSEQLGFHIV